MLLFMARNNPILEALRQIARSDSSAIELEIEKAGEFIDLTIAHTTIVPDPIPIEMQDMLANYIPALADATKRSDARYQFIRRDRRDFGIVSPEELKVMRARYLILRGLYNKLLEGDRLIEPERSIIIRDFFNGTYVNLKKLIGQQ